VIMPPVGSHCRVPPKTMSRMRPSQKVGTDQKISEVEEASLSNSEFRLQAESWPSHSPMPIAMTAAVPVSSRVGPRYSTMSEDTVFR